MKSQDIAVKDTAEYAKAFIAKAKERFEAWRTEHTVEGDTFPGNLRFGVASTTPEDNFAEFVIRGDEGKGIAKLTIEFAKDSYAVKVTVRLARSDDIGDSESQEIFADEIDAVLDHAIPTMLTALSCWHKKQEATMEDVSVAIVNANIPPLAIRRQRPLDQRRNPRAELQPLTGEPPKAVEMPKILPSEIPAELDAAVVLHDEGTQEVVVRVPQHFATFMQAQCAKNNIEMTDLVCNVLMNVRIGELMALAQATGKVHQGLKKAPDA